MQRFKPENERPKVRFWPVHPQTDETTIKQTPVVKENDRIQKIDKPKIKRLPKRTADTINTITE